MGSISLAYVVSKFAKVWDIDFIENTASKANLNFWAASRTGLNRAL